MILDHIAGLHGRPALPPKYAEQRVAEAGHGARHLSANYLRGSGGLRLAKNPREEIGSGRGQRWPRLPGAGQAYRDTILDDRENG